MTWEPQRKLFGIQILIDTNCVNSRQAIPELNILEEWAASDLIDILTSEVAQKEMLAGRDALRHEKAFSLMFSMSLANTDQEKKNIARIEQILFPGGATTQAQKNDVEIVFNAGKYCAILVTNDGGSKSQPGGILGNADSLRHLGITVMSPREAVEHIRRELKARDKTARRWAEVMQQPLPDWVGTE
jgi:hypothetical protein